METPASERSITKCEVVGVVSVIAPVVYLISLGQTRGQMRVPSQVPCVGLYLRCEL